VKRASLTDTERAVAVALLAPITLRATLDLFGSAQRVAVGVRRRAAVRRLSRAAPIEDTATQQVLRDRLRLLERASGGASPYFRHRREIETIERMLASRASPTDRHGAVPLSRSRAAR